MALELKFSKKNLILIIGLIIIVITILAIIGSQEQKIQTEDLFKKGISKELKRAGQQLVEDLNRAKSLTLSSNISHGLYFNSSPTSYILFLDRDQRKYRYDTSPEDEKIEEINLPSGIEIDEFTIQNIVFRKANSVVLDSNFSPGLEAKIVLKEAGTSCPSDNCLEVSINTSGEIEIKSK